MQIENNDGAPITSVAEWRRLAPPASSHHWREYRSACELAYAWIEGDADERLRDLLALALTDVAIERGIAERKTFFDGIPSGPRNHDLLAIGRASAGPLVVGIEAKADESFDERLSRWSEKRLQGNPASRGPERLDALTRAFFDTTREQDPSLDTLRYQLLSALAGTLADAKAFGAAHAALVVHEFETPETTSIKQDANAVDLDAFVGRLGTAPRAHGPDGSWIAGPFTVPGNGYLPGDVPFYVGKLRTVVHPRVAVRTIRELGEHALG